MNIFNLLDYLIENQGSDIHVIVGHQPVVRVDGELRPVETAPVLSPDDVQALIDPLLTPEQKEFVRVNKELDLGYQYGKKGRFRTNIYHSQGHLAACLRLIPTEIRTIEELNLPSVLHKITEWQQGFVLITGPTGEGKSSTLAAIIDEINRQRAEHIVTIEDPIEFVYEPKQSIISQRQLHRDTQDWNVALRSVLREDPDIILVGEMRDAETMGAAITAAETGHLVFATLHTSTAAQTIDRIIDVFPSHQQSQVRQQLAANVKAVVSQRLLKRIQGGRVPALEIMIANNAIRNLIREEKIYQIDNVIQTAAQDDMILMENYLLQLVQKGAVARDVALRHSFRPHELRRLMGM